MSDDTSVIYEEAIIVSHDRIMAGINLGEDGYIHMHFVDFFPEEYGGGAREGYTWKIYDSDMVLISEAREKDDYVCGGVGEHVQPLKMMVTMLSFLLAAAEAGDNPESENYDLFDRVTTEWAMQNSDALQVLQFDLNPEGL